MPMSAHHDAGEFIDSDFQPSQATVAPAKSSGPAAPNRPPTREEIEAMVSEKQIRLAELKRAQEELERERAGLEELRRRQVEFQTGRDEMLHNLTRGIGLLEEAEMSARRETEAMARTLADFRVTVQKVQAINEKAWTSDNHHVELTTASTTVENARMEWNSARLRFSILSGTAPNAAESKTPAHPSILSPETSMLQLFKIGLALTWPLVVLGAAIFAALLWRH